MIRALFSSRPVSGPSWTRNLRHRPRDDVTRCFFFVSWVVCVTFTCAPHIPRNSLVKKSWECWLSQTPETRLNRNLMLLCRAESHMFNMKIDAFSILWCMPHREWAVDETKFMHILDHRFDKAHQLLLDDAAASLWRQCSSPRIRLYRHPRQRPAKIWPLERLPLQGSAGDLEMILGWRPRIRIQSLHNIERDTPLGPTRQKTKLDYWLSHHYLWRHLLSLTMLKGNRHNMWIMLLIKEVPPSPVLVYFLGC